MYALFVFLIFISGCIETPNSRGVEQPKAIEDVNLLTSDITQPTMSSISDTCLFENLLLPKVGREHPVLHLKYRDRNGNIHVVDRDSLLESMINTYSPLSNPELNKTFLNTNVAQFESIDYRESTERMQILSDPNVNLSRADKVRIITSLKKYGIQIATPHKITHIYKSVHLVTIDKEKFTFLVSYDFIDDSDLEQNSLGRFSFIGHFDCHLELIQSIVLPDELVSDVLIDKETKSMIYIPLYGVYAEGSDPSPDLLKFYQIKDSAATTLPLKMSLAEFEGKSIENGYFQLLVREPRLTNVVIDPNHRILYTQELEYKLAQEIMSRGLNNLENKNLIGNSGNLEIFELQKF